MKYGFLMLPLLLCVLLGGCGQYGNLYLPKNDHQAKTKIAEQQATDHHAS